MSEGGFEFDLAISFAGENRATAQKFAEILRGKGLRVFYDDWESASLWGRDLYEHLDEVYSKKARYCVMFLSEAYARKAWTNHERRSAQARAFKENKEYILPVRLDDTEIPGIKATIGYLDLRKMKIDEVACLAFNKVTGAMTNGSDVKSDPCITPHKVGKLRAKKKFKQFERDEYLETAFEIIETFFKETLKSLPSQNPDFKGKFKKIAANHFTATIYEHGDAVAQCGIRLGGLGGLGFMNQIVYSNDPSATNTMNEGVSVSDDGKSMFLKSAGLSSGARNQDMECLTPHDAAELFWGILTIRLQ